MVCLRCKMVVADILSKLDISYLTIELGEVTHKTPLTQVQKILLQSTLLQYGLELIEDRKKALIERIKNIIIEQVHHSDEPLIVNFSDFLHQKLKYDYTYLANLFSSLQGITIEKFIIFHKIEKVKELLVYNEHNLTDIAYLMHYSSVAHLSHQFKKVTGFTPSFYKALKGNKRNILEAI